MMAQIAKKVQMESIVKIERVVKILQMGKTMTRMGIANMTTMAVMERWSRPPRLLRQ